MRAVIQRVKSSFVTVGDEIVGNIDSGLLVLLGVAKPDQAGDADFLAEKIVNLRIFEDEQGKMNRSLISQFTLLGDCRKGRRPSFIDAAGPDKANELYEHFVAQVRKKGVRVATGRFRAMMEVSLINDGPVTLIVESK